ncbi:SGNH/GDSL hydrolase family protein [Streptomyces sp. NPDC002825]|uniref:SGNH/GDSL hydrolase family protein n=1 Tax=Streptomyces sp. NPDC002825 TaxID=3154666 RepID=UPI0033174D13
MTAKKLLVALPLTAVLMTAAVPAVAAPGDSTAFTPWRSAWATAPQAPTHTDWYANWSEEGFDNQSVRQVIRVGAEGSRLRIRLSNVYGTAPLRVTGATIARSAGGAAARAESVRTVRFGGAQGVSVPAGGELSSDAVALPVRALEQLTVTLYFRGRTGPATFHNFADTLTYRASGDHLDDAAGEAFAGEPSLSWYYLAGVDVKPLESPGGGRGRDAVVAFGDSLTDGVGSTFGADRRYPDVLADRLVAEGRTRPVLNLGIGGNKVLNDSPCFGESALARFRRDVLGRRDVRTVIVLQGTNDIVLPDSPQDRCTTPSPFVTSAQIVAGHQELIREAHARGVKVIGATLPPYQGFAYWTERGDRVRSEVNQWIRTSGAYDGVVDFDRAVADPEHPERIAAQYVSADLIHMKDAGYKAMADAVDLNSL